MGISSAMDWWEEWQLRILVLGSCFIQYVLFFSVWMRRAPVLRRLRVLVWVAYIGGDAVAIYALATLFNRRKQTWYGESSALEVTVALYVFCKWWSGEKRLLVAAILLFLLGILKFSLKPWALRTASFNSMQTSITVFLLPEAQREGHIYSLEEYVQAAKKCLLETKVGSQHGDVIDSNNMFFDLSAPYSFRIAQLRSFQMLEDMHAYNVLQFCLGIKFNTMYSRLGSIATYLGVGSMLLLPILALACTVLFTTSHKDGHNEKDITVTYILFSCTTVLEFLLPCMLVCYLVPSFKRFLDKNIEGWHDMVSQYNLTSFCVRKRKPTFLMKLATFNSLKDFINQHWYIQHVHIAFQITGVVRQHLEDGWKKYIHDAASYRRFSELRGQWALRRHHQLRWSLKMTFDESILIWHVATDLCFYHPNTSLQCRQGEGTQCSREISNYMVYLLLIHPEMLMPGTRSNLFTSASDKIVGNSKGLLDTEEMTAQEILNMPMLPIATDMVSSASKLSKALMELNDEKER
ncbi:hypothetical protein ACQ4PT_042823 [Festuca glaucescens]